MSFGRFSIKNFCSDLDRKNLIGGDFMVIGTSSGSILLRQLDTLTLSEVCLFSVLLLLILFFIVKGLTK